MRARVPDLASYDWIVVSSSGGKDSAAMLIHLMNQARREGVDLARLVVVHADLASMEWPGTSELVAEHAAAFGLRFEVVAHQHDLLTLVRQRHARLLAAGRHTVSPWPSERARFCTSGLKTGPVTTLMTRLVRETRTTRPGRQVRLLHCLGLRAGESPARARRIPFGPDPANWHTSPKKPTATSPGRAGRPHGRREVDRWLPIHTWNHSQVWDTINGSGLRHHPAYDLGLPRASCVLCVLAGRRWLVTGARLNPELAMAYYRVELDTGWPFRPGLSMAQVMTEAGLAHEVAQVRTEFRSPTDRPATAWVRVA
ncbi:3'-phosphoadenosine 5'-phosphosulfate sulfotransferase (PAPS reductase)/FAD synthetase [Crossiella equi]|uniref:3'-phosphoadenosine 5'-phosphosulfate sulfotransferase (PAPS reductase)/FAD synthetase n=1 Tax=Crossiella equi TaxID=130796 RepID=A0ABS5AMB2_9PSEU|nr:phosphoadenosine phosphosulfate reductase family protein [Crossiella equi]MBP2477701.1 3'-phosphoadenosine 5'-phosphosulfate sulfotransferase (PAPS reductase)/FAD synthetase [Crossiella equi]